MTYLEYQSPCGTLLLAADQGRLCLCDWTVNPRHQHNLDRLSASPEDNLDEALLKKAVKQLDEYFAGLRGEFDIEVAPSGTPFQKAVWQAISEVPYGCVISYKALARSIGRQQAIRAVASAVASNPISLFIPCHRIVGSQGQLTGYAGTLSAKQHLLTLEHK